jgi:hypothetical protein
MYASLNTILQLHMLTITRIQREEVKGAKDDRSGLLAGDSVAAAAAAAAVAAAATSGSRAILHHTLHLYHVNIILYYTPALSHCMTTRCYSQCVNALQCLLIAPHRY